MSRWSEREIARKLAERDELEPPAGLLEKIKSEIPPMIPVETGVPEIDRRPSSMPPRQRWLIAASVILMVGAGGLLTLHRMDVPPVEETPRTVAGARPPERLRGAPPPPPAVPPPAARSFSRQLVQPSEVPAPKPSRREEEKLKSLGYVGSGVEGRVEGGVAGGVMGGAPGGGPAAPPVAAPAPPPPPMVQAQAEKPEAVAESPLLDERRREADRINVGGNESGQQSPYAGPAAADRPRPAPAPRALAKTADAGIVWMPPPFLAPLKADTTGTASYDVVRRAIAAGRLPDPGAIRVEEILNAFDTGGAPAMEGASTPFVHGPQYRLLRIDMSSPIRLTLNPTWVARCRMIGNGVSLLYEVELRSDVTHTDEAVAMLGLGDGATGLTFPQLTSWDKASPGFRLAALVAEFAEILKSPSPDPSALRRLSQEIDKLPKGRKASELRKLVEGVRRIQQMR